MIKLINIMIFQAVILVNQSTTEINNFMNYVMHTSTMHCLIHAHNQLALGIFLTLLISNKFLSHAMN